jgi:hypothetical protein
MGTQEELKVQVGEAWTRLAHAVAREIPPAEVDGVWVFRAIRQELREFGTAVLSRVEGDRRRIYTARYIHTIKGKDRGKFTATVAEVGSGPVETLEALIRGVEKRADDEIPSRVEPSAWFPPDPGSDAEPASAEDAASRPG